MDYSTDRKRESVLTGLVALLGLGGVVFVFFLICGGMALFIVAVVGGLTGLCYVNYLLWGRSLSEQVTGEREELELQDSLERDEEDWEFPGG